MKITKEFVEKRKELASYKKEDLELLKRHQLRELCMNYGINYGGTKRRLIDNILRAREIDENFIEQSKQRKVRMKEIRQLKKRKIDQDEFLQFHNQLMPRHLILKILQYLPRDRSLLDNMGSVNSQYYKLVRSKDVWTTINIHPNILYYIPVPMLHGCTKIILHGKFSSEHFVYIGENVKNVKFIEANPDCASCLNKTSFRGLFKNKDIRNNLLGLNVNGLGRRGASCIEWVIDQIESKNLQILKIRSENYFLRPILSHKKICEIVKKFPNLTNLDLLYWRVESAESYGYIFQNLKSLEKFAGDIEVIETLRKIEKLPNIISLGIGPSSDLSFNYDMNIISEKLPNLKQLELRNSWSAGINLDIKCLQNVQEVYLETVGELDRFLNFLKSCPNSLSKLTVRWLIYSHPVNTTLSKIVLPQLRYLDIQEYFRWEDQAIIEFANIFPNLEILKIKVSNSLTKNGILALKNFKKLKCLFVSEWEKHTNDVHLEYRETKYWLEVAKEINLKYLDLSWDPTVRKKYLYTP